MDNTKLLCKDCLNQRDIPNEQYNYIYEMRKLCIINNMVFLQCDSCKRVDIVSTDYLENDSDNMEIKDYKQIDQFGLYQNAKE